MMATPSRKALFWDGEIGQNNLNFTHLHQLLLNSGILTVSVNILFGRIVDRGQNQGDLLAQLAALSDWV